jgi:hypothetical protein
VTEVFKVLEVVNPTSIVGMGWEPVYEVGTTPSTPAAARLDKKHKVKK